MLIVDSQIHLWPGPGSSPRHGNTPFTAEAALAQMDDAGITAAVIHPPDWDPTAPRYAAETAERHPHRFARYATVPLDGEDDPNHVQKLRDAPTVLGLRYLCLQQHEWTWPQDGTMEWMFRAAQDAGLPVTLCGPTLMPVVARVAEEYPALKLIVDHFGLVAYGEDGGLVQHPDVLSWGRFPNVAVKLTGAPDYATDAFPFPSMIAVVHALYDAYGPARLFWGTDITRVNGHGGTPFKASWQQCVTMFTENMDWLGTDDLELILGRAYCDWHSWTPQ